MTDFPDIRLKIIPLFPADVRAGPGITITKENGVYTINNTYLVEEIGIEEAPIDGAIYARKNGAWFLLYASGEAPPAPSGGFTTSLAGPGTLVVPFGKTTMIGEAWGGGGGGSGYGGTGANRGAGGGAYSRFTVSVTPGQTIYFNVGAGGVVEGFVEGRRGGNSWVNPTANVIPTSVGCVAGGGGGGTTTEGSGGGGSGTIGTVNYNGGNGVASAGGGGGGGAGSAGPGSNATGSGPVGLGGAGGPPDGGAGGHGGFGSTTNGLPGSPIGGGGGGGYGSVTAGAAGANGQIRLSFT